MLESWDGWERNRSSVGENDWVRKREWDRERDICKYNIYIYIYIEREREIWTEGGWINLNKEDQETSTTFCRFHEKKRESEKEGNN